MIFLKKERIWGFKMKVIIILESEVFKTVNNKIGNITMQQLSDFGYSK